ncbi:hypothetical protein OSTOST_12109 [Ostertagia ostertagi]
MAPSRFELLCIVLLGLGHMCIFIGYDAQGNSNSGGIQSNQHHLQTFVVESVLHSVNSREPKRIDAHAGYYGQATCYMGYMLACLITPSLLPLLSAKWSLFLGSISWTIYHAGFFYLNNYFYYFSSALMGIGFACESHCALFSHRSTATIFYTGYTAYLTSHSTRNTIEQNSAIAWSIGNLCLLFGGAVLFVVFHLNDPVTPTINGNSTTAVDESVISRQFNDEDIFWMYASFAAIAACSNMIFFFIPARDIKECIEGGRPQSTLPFGKEMRKYDPITTQGMLYFIIFSSQTVRHAYMPHMV